MTPINDEMFSVRVQNFLRNERIFTLDALAAYGLIPALRAPNIGRKSIREMSEVLDGFGMKFVDEGLQSTHPSLRFNQQPDGYGGKWLNLDPKKDRASIVARNLRDISPVVSGVSAAAADLIEDAAFQISALSQEVRNLEKINNILCSDNEQLWLALTSPLAAYEAGLTVAGVLASRRKRLLGVKENPCGND